MKRRKFLGAVAASPLLAGCIGFLDSNTLGGIAVIDFNSGRGAAVDLEVTLDEETVYDERIDMSEQDDGWTHIDEFPDESGTYHITASVPDFDSEPLSFDPGETNDHDCVFILLRIRDTVASDERRGSDASDEVAFNYSTMSCEAGEQFWSA